MIDAMPNLQRIFHNDKLAAVVVADEAIIDNLLPVEDFRHVQAMCLYALELAAQGRAEAYTDTDADAYAQAATSRR